MATGVATGCTLEPGTSRHSTATSDTRAPVRAARSRSSTSAAQPWSRRLPKSTCAARRLNSLKPHCVSQTPPPPPPAAARARARKPQASAPRAAARSAPRRDPNTATGAPASPSAAACPSAAAMARSSRSRSAKRVAPSASAISTRRPRDASTPAFTARPLPPFRGCRRTRTCPHPCRAAYPAATPNVPSVEPSSTTSTSQVKPPARARRSR